MLAELFPFSFLVFTINPKKKNRIKSIDKKHTQNADETKNLFVIDRKG